MRTGPGLLCFFIAGLGTATVASATSISVTDGLGTGLSLEAGPMSWLFDGVDAHAFTSQQLGMVHNALGASGIDTDGIITILPVMSADGLSLLTLVDDRAGGPAGEMNRLAMHSVAPTGTGYYVNDLSTDPLNAASGAEGETMDVQFNWRENRADGFAWAGLGAGDIVDFDFEQIEGNLLGDDDSVQFVGWTGEGWERAGIFGGVDEFGTTISVIPGAPVLALGVIALVSARRRRRVR